MNGKNPRPAPEIKNIEDTMAYRALKRIFIFIIITVIVCSALVYFLLFTTRGGIFLAESVISRFSRAEIVAFEDARGSIIDKFTLKNVSVKGLKELPPDSEMVIRQIDIRFTGFGIDGLHAVVSGGSMILPTEESIFFYGGYSAGLFDFTIYSKRVALDSLIALLGPQSASVLLKGRLSQIDLFVKGSLRDSVLTGTAIGERLEYKSFSLIDAPLTCDLAFTNKPADARVNGSVVIKKGTVSGRNTAVIALDESRLIFSGDLSKPRLDVTGRSTVEKIKIRISVKGTFDKPDIQLFSDPLLPQEQLLVMLATGKKWAGLEAAVSKGEISSDLAMDFFDYFVLGGSGSKIAKKFGITGFSVTYDETKKGIGVTGAVSDRVEVGYGVVRTQSEEKTPEITQKLSGELKVTDTVSLGVEKELKQPPAAEGSSADQTTNDTVMIKFKTRF